MIITITISRYARTQFVDPNAGDELEEAMEAAEKEFYSNSDESEDEDGGERKRADAAARPKMDADHRLLLRDAVDRVDVTSAQFLYLFTDFS